MKKSHLFSALILMSFIFVQCTDDETVEEAVYTSGQHRFISGEEGDQELVCERD